ncbi:MAG: MATE family efflux transporter [Clostridia bacterium]|nr:MATE family efflux transporter [Clostridia bacterium]
MIRTKENKIDMTTGPMFVNIIRFMMPLILTNLLQHFYNAADMMIVELSSEPDAVGAVGSTSTFLSLITNLFIGFSVGANVVVAKNIGENDKESISRAVHTSICMSLLFGVIGSVLGIIFTRPVHVAMGFSGNLLELAVRYSYIYLICMPFLSMTNFLSSILRAQGDSKTTLYILTATGLLNILLNLFFVLALGLSVEGVAIATAIANLVSATALWRYLMKKGGDCRISLKKLRIYRAQFAEISRIGFPAGIQNALFSVSNMLIQSSILQINNTLTPPGSEYEPVMKGNTAVANIESFIFNALAATTVTSSTVTAQNMGARKCRRARTAFGYICFISTVIAVVMTGVCILLRDPILYLYGVKNAQDILSTLNYNTAITRIFWKWPGFFIYAIMNACAGTIRGLGKSSTSAIITFFGTCVFRIVWIYTVFRYFENLESIYISYPISWLITGIFFLVVLFILFDKKIKEDDKYNMNT